jgi:RNA polymerase sigma-70 factor, ECF subfamily
MNLVTPAYGQITGEGSILKDRDKVNHAALNRFLASVERRAFLIARTALRHQEDALDVVQDAMLILVRKYSSKPEEEWRPLFYRVLNNRITDVVRRRTVRNRFSGFLPTFGKQDEPQQDPFQQVPDSEHNSPYRQLEQEQSMAAITEAVKDLPLRQQQAFMLRCWEGMSTAETAAVMACTEGSVKTHYSRALQSLKSALEEYRQ